ncbi:MAG: hypothetical protein Q9M36_05005 [Sulfurovum sp.]|nr:hypothetical protein [Sulfurovum sp.]
MGSILYGVDRFYSSSKNQVIKSLAFLNLSLISVETRKAYPLSTQQIVRDKRSVVNKR